MEKYEGFYVKLITTFNKLGGPDYIVCGPEIASIFETSSSLMSEKELPDFTSLDLISGYKLGRVNNRFDVFVDVGFTNIINVYGTNGRGRLTVTDWIF